MPVAARRVRKWMRPPCHEILITIAARFGRISWKHSSIAYALILKDVGVLPQTLYLMTTRTGLGGCAIGVRNIDLFAKLTGIDLHVEGPVGQFALGRGSTVHGVFTGGNDASSYGVLAANAIARREPLGTLYLATAFFDSLLVPDVLTISSRVRSARWQAPAIRRADACVRKGGGHARAYWKGYLRLSLVTCPIELFPATSQAGKDPFSSDQHPHRTSLAPADGRLSRPAGWWITEHKGRGYELGRGTLRTDRRG